ncbi:hypothetical protein AX774_g5287 [Zancudomyces culisetae]|uniref:Uncharacterized protein n=1 Tax=Zancudomyces culisetae TaxID=1213189 RepID=A0A1R1PK56_ZANCU|nr:hypothetical protein AX774_g5287 [Zancudomyces culisetae]|eukprot:OMH81272.1 hypothetical protein AX774_g5287 [Zancudomyces culisetae]
MIKSVILSTLVASSALAFNSQNAQNQTLQGAGENNVLESNFNEMDYEHSPRRKKMTVELFRVGSGYWEPLRVGRDPSQTQGTFNIKANKCYAAPEFAAVKMSGNHINKGAFLACKEANCGGVCYIHHMNQGSSINELWFALGNKFAVSYSWIAPYF